MEDKMNIKEELLQLREKIMKITHCYMIILLI